MRAENIGPVTSSWTPEFLENHPDSGAVAERMAQSIISRMEYNNPELGIALEHSNALEDAELKYDFKVLLPVKKRGVAVEGDDLNREKYIKEKKRLGIQFTIREGKKTKSKKLKQIDTAKSAVEAGRYSKYIKKPVDDIVLVQMPMKAYGACFKKWLEDGKPSGGPEQYLSEDERERLVATIISGPAIE